MYVKNYISTCASDSKLVNFLSLSSFLIDLVIGLNKDFKKMLSENAEFRALSLKEIRTACDGTRKVEMICSPFFFLVLLPIYIFKF